MAEPGPGGVVPPAEVYVGERGGAETGNGHSRDGEVHNGGVLLHKKIVLGEPLDAEDEVRGQLGELKALQEVLLVGFVLLKGRKQKLVEITPDRGGRRQPWLQGLP